MQKRLGKDENSGFSGAILRFNGCCVIFPFLGELKEGSFG